jgi:hypothetical protein
MEYLSFAPNGQWTLCKATTETGALKRPVAEDGKPFHSISTSTELGNLPQDRGQRGTLHNFNQGKRPKPPSKLSPRKWGQPTHNVGSAYENQNPGDQL